VVLVWSASPALVLVVGRSVGVAVRNDCLIPRRVGGRARPEPGERLSARPGERPGARLGIVDGTSIGLSSRSVL
jgi:hypothetical protein